MTTMPTSCPICNYTELHAGAESCPQCGSDIEVFSHIEGAEKERTFQKKSILILAGLLGIVVVSWGSVSLFSGDKDQMAAETGNTDAAKVISSVPDSASLATAAAAQLLQKENEDLKSELASLKSEIKASKASTLIAKPSVSKAKKKVKTSAVSISSEKSEDGIIIHTVKRGDSPWKISRKYFKNGSHTKQIVADNNLQNAKTIPIGTKLKIQK